MISDELSMGRRLRYAGINSRELPLRVGFVLTGI
jgi:hypothetical protein